jgi:hypothetical protein
VIVNRVLETVHIPAHVIDAVLTQEMLNASVERLSDLVSRKRLSIVFELGFQQSIEHWRPNQSQRLSNLGVTKRTPRQFPPIRVVSRWPFSPYSPAPSCMKACKNTSASRRDGNGRNASIFPVGLNTAATNGKSVLRRLVDSRRPGGHGLDRRWAVQLLRIVVQDISRSE